MTAAQVVGFPVVDKQVPNGSYVVIFSAALFGEGRIQSPTSPQNLGGDENMSHDCLPEETGRRVRDDIGTSHRLPFVEGHRALCQNSDKLTSKPLP
jgi:hypothetical protein